MGFEGSSAHPPLVERQTVVERLRRILSEEIVTGVLGPGVRLDEQSLADRFSVSRTPVREVLGQLAALGLVEKRAHRGVIVLVQSRERVLELFEVMREVEAACARLAAERMNAADSAALRRLHESAARLVSTNDVPGYRSHNTEFHQAIYEGTGNSALVDTAVVARRRIVHYRRAQFSLADRLRLSQEEHARIVEAIEHNDGEAAYRAMKAHIDIVREAAASFLKTGQDTTGILG